MNSEDLQASQPSTPYHCSNCSRCFIAVTGAAADELVCVCGARLVPESLPRGIYELRSMVPDDSRTTSPSLPTSSPGIPQEADLGYGKSHGYGPAHGGPTGPGDAPASGEERDVDGDRASEVQRPRKRVTHEQERESCLKKCS
jgi:hypothetical protein